MTPWAEQTDQCPELGSLVLGGRHRHAALAVNLPQVGSYHLVCCERAADGAGHLEVISLPLVPALASGRAR
jgi:hypothetical protein